MSIFRKIFISNSSFSYQIEQEIKPIWLLESGFNEIKLLPVEFERIRDTILSYGINTEMK